MTSRVALGDGPISFFVDGTQVSVPLSAIAFDDSDIPVVRDPYTSAKYPGLDTWVQYLARAGRLYPDAKPPAKVALLVQATDQGVVGNSIEITIEYPNPAQANTFDVTVTEQVVYAGLTPQTLVGTLGTENQAGLRPGPVFARSTGTPSFPHTKPPKKTSGAEATSAPGTAGTPATRASVQVFNELDTNESKTAFFLDARKWGEWGNQITVSIEVDPASRTFTLFATWKVTLQGLTVDTLVTPDKTNPLALLLAKEIVVTRPPGGAALPPQPGTSGLGGGADPENASRLLVAKA